MANVVVQGQTVKVYGADATSLDAVKTARGNLNGASLRANGLPNLRIVLVEGPMPLNSCDPRLAGGNALYFVKPWFWFNVSGASFGIGNFVFQMLRQLHLIF